MIVETPTKSQVTSLDPRAQFFEAADSFLSWHFDNIYPRKLNERGHLATQVIDKFHGLLRYVRHVLTGHNRDASPDVWARVATTLAENTENMLRYADERAEERLTDLRSSPVCTISDSFNPVAAALESSGYHNLARVCRYHGREFAPDIFH